MSKDLKNYRNNIDKIDSKIIDLLSERQKNVVKISAIKKKEKLNVSDQKREKEVLVQIKKKQPRKKLIRTLLKGCLKK